MIKKTRSSYLLTLAFTLISICSLSAQYDKINPGKFKDQLEEGAKLIGSGENFTIEKTADKHYVFKTYDPESKQLLEKSSFSNKKLTEKDGPIEKYNNSGGLILKGTYLENELEGIWIANYYTGSPKEKGAYKTGKKDGTWEYFNFDGELCLSEIWKEGSLISEEKFHKLESELPVYSFGDTALTKKPSFIDCSLQQHSNPTGICGEKEMLLFVYTNIRYPMEAIKKGLTGVVVMSFVVERDGSVSNVAVVKSVDESLDEESLRVMSIMPTWIPGEINGDPVRVRYNFPIRYQMMN